MRHRLLAAAAGLLLIIPTEWAYANDDREFVLAVITTLLVAGSLVLRGPLLPRLFAAVLIGIAGLVIDFL